MPDADDITHTVAQGEWLHSIARTYRVADPDRIWNYPPNAGLASARDPNILYPGDELVIPAPVVRQESCGTEQRHCFKLKRLYDRFEVTLQDPKGGPYKNARYRLTVGGQEFTGRTDEHGTLKVEKLILDGGTTGRLELTDLGLCHPVQIGYLNPIESRPDDSASHYDDGLTGALMRLRNLGYYDGPVPNSGQEPQLDSFPNGDPIIRFQTHQMGRPPEKADGKLDSETRDAIKRASLT